MRADSVEAGSLSGRAHLRGRRRRQGESGSTAVTHGMIVVWLALGLSFFFVQQSQAESQAEPAVSPTPGGGGSRFDAAIQERLVEQKLRLLQSYLSRVEGGRVAQTATPEIEALIAEARTSFRAAQEAFAAGDLSQSASLTDQGLRSIGRASAAAGPRPSQKSKTQSHEHLSALRRQIESYLQVLKSMLQEPALQTRHKSAVSRIESLLARSAGLESQGAYSEAGVLLAEAYPVTLQVVAELHQGRTHVARLEFSGPEEEFNYELKRYQSYELLVSLTRQDQGATRRIPHEAMTGQYIATARTLYGQAAEEARQGHHAIAIRTMEQAIRQLVYALQVSGVQGLY